MSAAAGSALLLRLDGRDVDGLRALVAVLGVVRDPGTLCEGAEPVRVDARVVDEEVLAALVRSDEAEALLVAEPLHGSGCHMSSYPSRDVRALCERGGCYGATTAGAGHCFAGHCARPCRAQGSSFADGILCSGGLRGRQLQTRRAVG